MKEKKPLTNKERQAVLQFFDFFKMIKGLFNDDIKGFLSPTNQKANRIIQSLPQWGGFYELPEERFMEMFSQTLMQVGLSISMDTFANSPRQVLLESQRRLDEGWDEENRAVLSKIDEEGRNKFLPLYFAMLGQLKCLSMFGMSLNHLLMLAKNSDEALFRAVLVDSVVIQTLVIAKRIKVAEAMGDSAFLEELAKSLSKSKARRHKGLDDMRVMIAVIEKQLGLETLTDDDLVTVFQRDLKLIGEEGEDSLDAIKWHIRKWKQSQGGKF